MKPFSRRQLEENLVLTNEEIKLIMNYQRIFPELLQDEEEENPFVVNSRTLHEHLEVGKDYTTWVKERVSNYNFIQDKDFIVIWSNPKNGEAVSFNGNPRSMAGKGYQSTYMLTKDCGKEIAMVENKPNSQVCRNYFILMEKVVHDMIEWERIHKPEKEGYKKMCSELFKYYLRNQHRKPYKWEYAKEADTINIICLGAIAREIKLWTNAQDSKTRDHLTAEYNKYIVRIQELNTIFLGMNYTNEVRYEMLKMGFKVAFPEAVNFAEARTYCKQLQKENNENQKDTIEQD